jgi:hypothetical protein
LTGIGADISKRQAVRLISDHLDAFTSQERDMLRTAPIAPLPDLLGLSHDAFM